MLWHFKESGVNINAEQYANNIDYLLLGTNITYPKANKLYHSTAG